MTLSDPSVQKLLKRRFVCARLDTADDPVSGESFAHPPEDPPPSCIRGNGEHNVQILILTPDGKLLSALAGFVGADELVRELKRGLELADRVRGLDAERAAEAVRRSHDEFLAEFERQEDPDESDPFGGFFAKFERDRVVSDHRFSAENALLDAAEFTTARMVGNARTFFGSSTGRVPPERLGKQKGTGQEDG